MTIDSPSDPAVVLRPAQKPPAAPKLLARVRDAIRARHYSPRTDQAYVHWIRRYIFFHGVRHPAEMGKPELTAFLSHLAVAPPARQLHLGRVRDYVNNPVRSAERNLVAVRWQR